MGLKDVLTKEIVKLGSYEFRWKEPFLFRLRLHRDLPQRLVLTLGACLIGIGLALLAYSQYHDRSQFKYIILAGAGFGAVYAINVWFHTPTFNSGTVTVFDRKIMYRRTAFEWIWSVVRNGEWPLETISQAVHIPASTSGSSFDVLLLSINNSWTMLGIPADQVPQMREYFAERDIELEPGTSLPQGSTEPIPWRRAAINVVVGVVVLLTGWLVYK
jgi:hypothetical protein